MSKNFEIEIENNPINNEYLTPNLSIKYPEIDKPYENKKIAVTQNNIPASY